MTPPLRLIYCWVLIAGLCYSLRAVGQEEVLVVDDETVVVSDEAEQMAQPIAILPRDFDGQSAFHRQSSEAFVDPDDRLNLQPKYYFVLGEESPAVLSELAGNVLGRAQGDRPIERFALADNLDRAAASIDDRQAQWFPLSAERAGELNVGWEWLDYESSAPGLLVLSLPGTDDVTLRVVAGKQQGPEWLIERQLAARHFSVSELSPHGLRRGLLDTWDRPKSLGPKATFFGRVIAVLKQIEGRAAVDFYGEALHEDSDCRVWLPQLEGQAVAIRFVELPIIKESDVAVPVTVLAVRYEDATDGSQVIALDYPLCSPPILEQLRRLAGNRTSAGAEPAAGPDLAKLIGEDVLDEFSRRLVAGTYR